MFISIEKSNTYTVPAVGQAQSACNCKHFKLNTVVYLCILAEIYRTSYATIQYEMMYCSDR